MDIYCEYYLAFIVGLAAKVFPERICVFTENARLTHRLKQLLKEKDEKDYDFIPLGTTRIKWDEPMATNIRIKTYRGTIDIYTYNDTNILRGISPRILIFVESEDSFDNDEGFQKDIILPLLEMNQDTRLFCLDSHHDRGILVQELQWAISEGQGVFRGVCLCETNFLTGTIPKCIADLEISATDQLTEDMERITITQDTGRLAEEMRYITITPRQEIRMTPKVDELLAGLVGSDHDFVCYDLN